MNRLRLWCKRQAHVTRAVLHPSLRERIDKSHVAREQIALFRVLNVEFFPRESHTVTFRDPWSFPILFHPACNHLVRQHMEDIAQKVRTDTARLSWLLCSLVSRSSESASPSANTQQFAITVLEHPPTKPAYYARTSPGSCRTN